MQTKPSNIVKRLFDIIISILLLGLGLPILLFFGLLIFILDGAPIFYSSYRMVSAKKCVRLTKFRTMVKNATSDSFKLNERFMRNGYLDIPLDCEVYTKIGRILERTQIVESIQLVSILKNDMSFVGNRPLPQDNLLLLKEFDDWESRFDSPAGITGIAQIAGKYSLEPHQRLHLERMYSNVYTDINGNILLCDLLIIWYTINLLLTGRYLGYDKALALLVKCGAKNT